MEDKESMRLAQWHAIQNLQRSGMESDWRSLARHVMLHDIRDFAPAGSHPIT